MASVGNVAGSSVGNERAATCCINGLAAAMVGDSGTVNAAYYGYNEHRLYTSN